MESLRFLKGEHVSRFQLQAFILGFAACGIALFAATWRLWTPQTDYPQVPLFSAVGSLPRFVDWACFGGTLTSLGALVLFSFWDMGWRGPRRATNADDTFSKASNPELPSIVLWLLFTFAACTTLLFLLDQHRLQPWAFQFVVFAIVLGAVSACRAFVLLRLVVISIYFWSAIAKFDYSFAHSQGQQFLSAIVGLVGISADDWPEGTRAAIALLFPMAELFIAVGLCFPPNQFAWLRRATLAFIFVTHALLALVLSPLGLNHQPAVIIWNIWFLIQAWLLFRTPKRTDVQQVDGERTESPQSLYKELIGVIVEFLVAAVILLPALNMANCYDHWLAWGLYAPRNSRATLYLQQSIATDLPDEMRRHISEQVSEEGWVRMDLDQWSLKALRAPIYPEERFQVAVADDVIRRHQIQNAFQLVVESSASRFSGARRQFVIRNLSELETHRRRYLFNSKSRQ